MTFIIVGKNVIYIQSYNLLGFLPLGNCWSVTPRFYVYEYIHKIHKMIPRGIKEPTFVANILHASCCTWYFIVILKITLQSMRFPFYRQENGSSESFSLWPLTNSGTRLQTQVESQNLLKCSRSYMYIHTPPHPFYLGSHCLVSFTVLQPCKPVPTSRPFHWLFCGLKPPPPISKWLIPSRSHVLTQMLPNRWGFSWSS